MPAEATGYRGDDTLERLLSEAGARVDLAGLKDLLAGVLGAPEGENPEAWISLVAETPSTELRGQLMALKARMRVSGKPPKSDRDARLTALREELKGRGLDGFAVPHADAHQGEYLPPGDERLAWLTGFTGSAGMAIVLMDRAAIFVDGRYTLQARSQVNLDLYEPRHLIDRPPATWIEDTLTRGAKLGYDPWLHTEAQVKALRSAVEKAEGLLVACPDNPVDAIWTGQAAPPIAPVVAHPLDCAGRGTVEKRADTAQNLIKQKADAAVITLPDSIAWLLNVRGGDVAHTPLPLSFALLHADETVEWFVDRRKLVSGLESHLGNGISIASPGDFGPALDSLGRAGQRVLADPASAAAWIFQRLEQAGATLIRGADPCQLPKATKNPVELEGTRRAHRRDGAALTRFLAWIAAEAPARAENGGLGELEAAERLLAFRRENEGFRDLSFDTISGAGPNGAIVHYRATPESERSLGLGDLFLLDSGAQYPDGTTDVTRTIAVGAPGAEMRERFTLVLKGHIAIASARFPRGTTGSQLDTLARAPLWQAGLDYDHGTGHGVGSYLGVHEGPQRISKAPNRIPLEPGMIVSNEPGYYKTDAYGIRIENLVAVIDDEERPGDERPMLAFETLTLAPIDLALVEPALMTPDEVAWLDRYHARVRDTLVPLVDESTVAWLERATRPLGAR